MTSSIYRKVAGAWTKIAEIEDGAPAVSKAFDAALAAGAPGAGQIRARMESGTPADFDPLDADNAARVERIEIGLAAGDSDLRSYLPQVEAGDVVTVFEAGAAGNWAAYLLTAAPGALAAGAATVRLAVSHLAHGAAANVAGACRLGFSRAPRGAVGINWRSAWVANASPPYGDRDAVSHDGGSWLADGVPDATTEPPGSTWQTLAEAAAADDADFTAAA